MIYTLIFSKYSFYIQFSIDFVYFAKFALLINFCTNQQLPFETVLR